MFSFFYKIININPFLLAYNLVFVYNYPTQRNHTRYLVITTLKISALEKAVMSNIKSFGANVIPSKMLAEGANPIKSNQVSAVVNNMVAKVLLVRDNDLFGSVIQLTRSGKIRSTKIYNLSLAA